jgi:hypothetical protein
MYVFPASVLWVGVINLLQFTGINQPNMILPSPPLLGLGGVDGTTLVAHSTGRRNTKQTKQAKHSKIFYVHSGFSDSCLSPGGMSCMVEYQNYSNKTQSIHGV